MYIGSIHYREPLWTRGVVHTSIVDGPTNRRHVQAYRLHIFALRSISPSINKMVRKIILQATYKRKDRSQEMAMD